MGPSRLEAFSDGVLAIIITIMVLELHVPHETTLAALLPLLPTLFCYLLSFLYVGIYWNNHHHLLHACKRVSAGILWANLLLLAAISYTILQQAIVAAQPKDSALRRALGQDWKGKVSMALYACAVALALRWPAVSMALYVVVALTWLVPDRRIERALNPDDRHAAGP